MKITFVTPTQPDVSAFGVRALSAFLRAKGHETRIVFLPGSIGRLQEDGKFAYAYQHDVLEQIRELCRGSDLVGLSFMSNYFDHALQVTEFLKRSLTIPIIWGGIHPSCKPQECLEHADAVCVGEGEEALLEVMDKMRSGQDYSSVRNIWTKKGEAVLRNPVRPLISDLDTLPPFDFSNRDHYMLELRSGRIEPLTDELLKKTMPLMPSFDGKLRRAHRTMADRGCPHICSYCNMSVMKEMYKNDESPFLRAKSVGKVIEQLVEIKTRYPFVEAIHFMDDTFFARPPLYIEQFARAYKENVGLPFYCQASPNTLSADKLDALIDAGLVYVEMGIQSGSKRVRDLYKRTESNEKIIAAARLLHSRLDRLIPPDYHIILDNPWETEEDTMQTVRLLSDIPKPYGLCISSLVFFPGTALHTKALAEGLIKEETKDVYRKPFYVPPRKTYPGFLIYLFTFQHFPRWILGLLMREGVVRKLSGMRLSPLYRMAYAAGETCRFITKGIKALTTRDWQRIYLFLGKLTSSDPLVAGRKK